MPRIIQVENLSKHYRLGVIGSSTIREDLHRWWEGLRGRSQVSGFRSQVSDGIWALRDVSFEVQQGEILGIIGRNGAGKSTLLKILSRVTAPTSGVVRAKGRIASLLEVGTGFHPELTGRDNIFLNGAILGMTKSEVARKFDEIVDFSGVEKFIDTPVKRYSSGMYVRLAFAVAAHLEPEILLIDEVLAVGDAEFQKKCLGKMGDVAASGRTVLFVSHNMVAVQSLCRRTVLIHAGCLDADGRPSEVVPRYLRGDAAAEAARHWELSDAPGTATIRLIHVAAASEDETGRFTMQSGLSIEVRYHVLDPGLVVHVTLHIYTEQGLIAFTAGSSQCPGWHLRAHDVGLFTAVCHVPANLLNSGFHVVNVLIIEDGTRLLHQEEHAIGFEVVDAGARTGGYMGREPGVVQPRLDWTVQQDMGVTV